MVKSAKIVQWLIIGLLLAVLITGVALWYFLLVENIADSLTVEAGSSFSASDFKVRDVEMDASFVTDVKELDLTQPGEYPIVIAYYGRYYDSTLRIVDTVKPEVTTKDVTMFYTQYPHPEEFIERISDHTSVRVEYAEEPDMTVEGVQTVTLHVTDIADNVTVCTADLNLIFDRQAPQIQGVSDKRLYVGYQIDMLEGVTVTDDLDPAPVLTLDDSAVDQSKEGEYTVTYTATDVCGNTTKQTAILTVIHDTQGPQIFGVNKLSLYQGGTMAYRNGVILTDDYDEAPRLSVDSSQVNLNEPGTYNVVYTATDAAGNATTVETTVTVKEKKSSYVEESVIYAKADELLAKIVKDGMTVEEQVRAIYKWVRNNCYYYNYSDKTDRLQGAYRMMTKRNGDCFNYYAICSLFFERLGIPEISVRRSADSVRPTKHFWSMVSVDGGETYYHFDSCPTTAFSTNLCLVTDAVLKKCSRIAPGYFTMDEGVYPATPEEAL